MTSPEELVRYYTRARKFPTMVGKLPDGTNIPGGPYTSTQGLVGGGLLIVMWLTMGIWGRWGFFTNTALLVGVPGAAAFLVRAVRSDRRNLLKLARSTVGAYRQPRRGRLNGHSVRLQRAMRCSSRIAVDLGAPLAASAAPSGQRAAGRAPRVVPTASRPPAAATAPIPTWGQLPPVTATAGRVRPQRAGPTRTTTFDRTLQEQA